MSLAIGDSYDIQFVWRLPDNDLIRAVFRATVVEDQQFEGRYLVGLSTFVAGRQEAPDGTVRAREQMAVALWQRIFSFVGRKVQVAYESAENRPLYLRYATLTGEHNFFDRDL